MPNTLLFWMYQDHPFTLCHNQIRLDDPSSIPARAFPLIPMRLISTCGSVSLYIFDRSSAQRSQSGRPFHPAGQKEGASVTPTKRVTLPLSPWQRLSSRSRNSGTGQKGRHTRRTEAPMEDSEKPEQTTPAPKGALNEPIVQAQFVANLPSGSAPADKQPVAVGMAPVPKRSGTSDTSWGGIAMLAHCAQSASEGQGGIHVSVLPPEAAAAAVPTTTSSRGPAHEDPSYSRKDKSLGLLCDKFLQEYRTTSEVFLDASAKRLGVERRRIYDIVNVLESIDIVQKKAKNRYSWFGNTRVKNALLELKKMGSPEGEKDDDEADNSDGDEKAGERTPLVPWKKGSRKEKSLGELSKKFVRLFLNAEDGVVSLESAARKLMDDANVDDAQLKTKIRRLYDIANILCSLGLIEKTHLADSGRKPAFKWKSVDAADLSGAASAAQISPSALGGASSASEETGKRAAADSTEMLKASQPLGTAPKRARKNAKDKEAGASGVTGGIKDPKDPSAQDSQGGTGIHPTATPVALQDLANSMAGALAMWSQSRPAVGGEGTEGALPQPPMLTTANGQPLDANAVQTYIQMMLMAQLATSSAGNSSSVDGGATSAAPSVPGIADPALQSYFHMMLAAMNGQGHMATLPVATQVSAEAASSSIVAIDSAVSEQEGAGKESGKEKAAPAEKKSTRGKAAQAAEAAAAH